MTRELIIDLEATVRQRLRAKTGNPDSLGRLEELACQIARIQQTDAPRLHNPHLLVFAGDHGLTTEIRNARPTENTYERVRRFLTGNAAISEVCHRNGLNLLVCDVGVDGQFAENTPEFVKFKVRSGSRNMLHEPAMTSDECGAALDAGRTLVDGVGYRGCNVVGFGEMGRGNVAVASLLMHRLTGLPLTQCAGFDVESEDAGLHHELTMLQAVADRYVHLTEPVDILTAMGGLEIAALVGGLLQATENGMVVLIDGFVTTVALLVARALNPVVMDHCLFGHQSGESGHGALLAHLGVQPLLSLGLRLSEGTGCALAFPLIQTAVGLLNTETTGETTADE